jgi:DNA-binding beta-propeller fold protein YncE
MRWTPLLLAVLSVGLMSYGPIEAPSVFKTRGHPVATLVTPDGGHLLVTEDGANEDTSSPGVAGLEVFRFDGHSLHSERFIRLPGDPDGMTLIGGSRTLAFGLGDAMGFLDLDAALAGTGKPIIIPFARRAAPHYLTTSQDGRFLFATIEYGGDGEAAIFALGHGKAGLSTTIRAVISVPSSAPDLVLSPDGSRLYVVSEIAPTEEPLAGSGQPMLDRNDCRQGQSGPQRNGVLYTFDVQALMRLSARPSRRLRDFARALLSRSAAGCSPVRLVISADGQRVFVSARGENRVLVFDARKLETDPDHALLHALSSGGESPVGLQLSADGRRLVVADSNRFNTAPGAIAVLDAETGQLLALFKAGTFPRNVETTPDGTTFVTDFVSNAIEVLAAR